MKKKVIILIGIIVVILSAILLISDNKNKYYQEISDIVVGFYQSDEFNEKDVKKKDLNAVKTFLSKLTHEDEEILLDNYIKKESLYYTSESNTLGVYKNNGKCFIRYEDLDFDVQNDEHIEMEPHKRVVCDYYFTVLYKSDFYPDYEVTKSNPKYDYVFNSSEKTFDGYAFTYYSTYDNSKLTVELIIENKQIVEIKVEL